MSHSDSPPEASFLSEGLRTVTDIVTRRPRVTLWLVGLSACIAVVLTVGYLKFKTDRSDLIDPNADFHQRWLSYTESFGDSNDIVVAIEGDDPERIKRGLDDLANRLKAEPTLFANVLYKVESRQLRQKGLQYTSPQSLERGLYRIDAMAPIIRGQWDDARLDQVASRFRNQLISQVRSRPRTEAETRRRNAQLTALLTHVRQLTASLTVFDRNPLDFRDPWPAIVQVDPALRDAMRQTVYILNDEGTMGFLKVRPAPGAQDGFRGYAPVIDRLREITVKMQIEQSQEDAAAQEKPQPLKIGLTGIPVLEYDEMRKSQSDMLKASFISLAGVGVLLLLGFRSLRHPGLTIIMLLVGMTWAFGYTTGVIGHLNILSVSFAAILIGLGIDFGIHYLARYLELRQEGDDLRPALAETSGTVGVGIVAAAITTAMAFFCATLTQFLGVAELGIIAGGGILLCALATFLVLPALIALSDSDRPAELLPQPMRIEFLRNLTAKAPLIVSVASVAVILGLGASTVMFEDGKFETRIEYDHNLLNLQAEGLESVELQHRIFEQHNDSVLYAVSLADTPEEARRLRREFEALPSVHRVEELGSRLPAHPTKETQLLIQAYRAKLAHLPPRPTKERLLISSPAPVGEAVENLYEALIYTGSASIDRELAQSANESARMLDFFLDRFARKELWQQINFLNEYQVKMTGALWGQLRYLATASDSSPLTVDDFPEELRSRFVSESGKWLVQVYPKEQIWDIEPLTKFVEDVRSVDPNATGTPLQNYEASRQIKQSYERAALYALVVILVVLLVDFLHRERKALVLLPPLLIVGFFGLTKYLGGEMPSPWVLAALYLGAVLCFAMLLDSVNLWDALLAMLPPVAGGMLMFGTLGLLGIHLNPANLIVLPLVLGIGVDDGVHVVHDYRSQTEPYRISSSTMNGILLTSLTSMVGFGSMMIASHRGLYSVGLTLVIGIASCLFVSLVTLPAILSLFSQSEHARLNAATAPDESSNRSRKSRQKSNAA